MEGTKACSKCGIVKPLTAFVRDRTKPSGRHSFCKECRRQHSAKAYEQGYLQQWLKDHPVRRRVYSMIANSKIRAAEKGLDHNLTVDYLLSLVTSHCPYLGTKLRWNNPSDDESCHTSPNSPSIDRIDSTKGYVEGNVVIVSHRANAIKNDATEEELFRIGRALSLLKAELAFPD